MELCAEIGMVVEQSVNIVLERGRALPEQLKRLGSVEKAW